MEEERIGALYARLLLRRLGDLWNNMFPRGLSRSPWLPVIVVGILILGPGLAWHLHRHGRFSTLKREIRAQLLSSAPTDLDAGRPGGQDPVILTRKPTAGSDQPEFLSATLLPGMGMTVLQITANLPSHGETSLLAAPTVQAVSAGAVEPPNGFMDDHGAVEVPWGGEFFGAATPVGTTVIANWKGHSIEEPTEGSTQVEAAEGGTLLSESSDSVSQQTTADGMKATALFRTLNTDDHWPSSTEVSVSAELEARTVDLVVKARNTGSQEEPMGFGWHPRFDLGGAARDQIQLQLPNGEVVEITDAAKGTPSGTLTQAPDEVARFQGHPAPLGSSDVSVAIVSKKPTEPGDGPSAELLNAAAGYGIRMTASSANVRELHVAAPADGGYVSLGMQSNLDDPFGKEWSTTAGGGIATLQPGESVEWHIRLEIFPIGKP